MKRINPLIIYLLIVSFWGCESAVEGLNVSPNNPTDAPADRILTTTEVANILLHEGEVARRSGIWASYFTGIDRQYESFQNYIVTASDFNASWEDVFVNVVRNARVARNEETSGRTDVLIAITRILETHAAATAADLWGNIPFSQVNEPFNFTPAYEPQAEVYGALLQLLDQAIDELQNGSIRPPRNADIHFDGARQSWIEVANTLKSRILLHAKDYEGAFAAAEMGISSAENSLLAPHAEGQDSRNLYQQLLTGNRAEDFSAEGAYLTELLFANSPIYRGNEKTDESARFAWYYKSINGSLQPNFEDGYFTAAAPFPLITFEENLLILAETAARTRGFEAALGYLNQYRQYLDEGEFMGQSLPGEGLRYEAYEASDFQPGGMENPDGIAAEQALLREILEERYVSFYGQIEGFNDLRRTWNEALVRVNVPLSTGEVLPQRFLYPQTEVDRNPNTPDPLPGFFEPTAVNE